MGDIFDAILKFQNILKDKELSSILKQSASKLIIIDANSSAKRLYGDKYNEWVCGGCWNKMLFALKDLVHGIRQEGFNLIVVFNGSLEGKQMLEWGKRQNATLQQVYTIQQHLQVHSNEFKAPPRVLELAPPSLTCALRLAFRRLNVHIMQTFDSHLLEVASICHNSGANFLLSNALSTLLLTPSSLNLALPDSLQLHAPLQGTNADKCRALSANALDADHLARTLDLHPARLPILAVLLGAVPHLLSSIDLQPVHAFLLETAAQRPHLQHLLLPQVRLSNGLLNLASYQEAIVRVVCSFLRELSEDLVQSTDSLSMSLFGRCVPDSDRRTILCCSFANALKFICNGANNALHELRLHRHQDLSLPESDRDRAPGAYPKSSAPSCSKNVTKNVENEDSLLSEVASGMSTLSVERAADCSTSSSTNISKRVSWARDVTSPKLRDNFSEQKQVPHRMLLMRVEQCHRSGMLHPWVLQVLTERSIKVENSLEEDLLGEWAGPPSSAVDLFRPMRRAAFAVLLNARQSSHNIEVCEWVVRPGTVGALREVVIARLPQLPNANGAVNCASLPLCEVLWLNEANQERLSRMRAFMQCMHVSIASRLLDSGHVPPHHLLYCCALRYLLYHNVLRSSELEVALAVAVSPVLMDLRAQRDLRLERLCPRAVRLSALVMRAVENAMFVNDACASPIPQEYTDPFLYFDGRLFLYKLEMSSRGVGLLQVCDNQIELVVKVEKMRAAVLDGLESHHAESTTPRSFLQSQRLPSLQPNNQEPPKRLLGLPPDASEVNYSVGGRNRSRGRESRSAGGPSSAAAQVDYRGGALEVGGVVVANWGPNLSARGNNSEVSALANDRTHSGSEVTIVPGESAGVIAPPLPRMQSRVRGNLPCPPPGGPPCGMSSDGPPGCPPMSVNFFSGISNGAPLICNMMLPGGISFQGPLSRRVHPTQGIARGNLRRRRRAADNCSGAGAVGGPTAPMTIKVNVEPDLRGTTAGRGCSLGSATKIPD